MDNVYDLTRTAKQIVALNPDLIALQEVDNNTQRHPGDDQTALLSVMTNLQYYVFAKQRNFQGGGFGVAILSRFPIEGQLNYYYHKPGQSNRTDPSQCFDTVEGDFCQGIVAIQVAVSGTQKLWFATTHLGIGLKDEQQHEEARQLVDWVRATVRPTGIPLYQTGDFNSAPTEGAIMVVKNSRLFFDAWIECGIAGDPGNTYSSENPFKRIDYLFMSPIPGAQCVQSRTPQTLASDHLPLVTDISFP